MIDQVSLFVISSVGASFYFILLSLLHFLSKGILLFLLIGYKIKILPLEDAPNMPRTCIYAVILGILLFSNVFPPKICEQSST